MGHGRTILFFVVDGFQTLDLFGPLEVFAAAAELSGEDHSVTIAARESGKIRSESGVCLFADQAIEQVERADILILPGGQGPRQHRLSAVERSALLRLSAGCAHIGSVCTGAFLLAQLEIARGRRLATHWRHTTELADTHPAITVDPDALFVREGRIWSSAGIMAGIDMALAMIAEIHGPAVTAAAARQLVVYLRRSGDQAQLSEPLAAQLGDSARIGDTIAWASGALDQPVTLEAMARRVHMSQRHFSRKFREHTGTTPARFVERLRLDRARVILSEGQARIDGVAAAVGYQDTATFRRAFERAFSLSPSEYRERFTTKAAIDGD